MEAPERRPESAYARPRPSAALVADSGEADLVNELLRRHLAPEDVFEFLASADAAADPLEALSEVLMREAIGPDDVDAEDSESDPESI